MIYDVLLLEQLLGGPILALMLFYHVMFVLAVWRKDFAIADIAWGMGFILVTALSLQYNRSPDARSWLVLGLICLWGVRLTLYLSWRMALKKREDFRYFQMRQSWGRWANVQAYFKVFWLQPTILIALSFGTMITVARSTLPLNFLDGLGALIAIAGLLIEAVADWQMHRFKQQPRNKDQLIRVGLWRHSRHPNYFGEMVFWWGLGFIALNSVLPLAAFNGGIIITLLLLKVSGAPLLEARYKDHPDYENYRKETNAFVPLQWRG